MEGTSGPGLGIAVSNPWTGPALGGEACAGAVRRHPRLGEEWDRMSSPPPPGIKC